MLSLSIIKTYGLISSKLTASRCLYSRFVKLNFLRSYSLNSYPSKTRPKLIKINDTPEKDKILFYYENPRFFHILNGFALVNFFFWIQMSEFTYKSMKDVDMALDTRTEQIRPWWLKIDFKDKTTRTAVATVCFFIGYGILATAWLYTLRSVRMLVLRKGGETVSIVTYAPLGGRRTLDISLDKMTTTTSRQGAKSQLPVKVQGKWFYYILDTKSGTFQDPQLFDYTAGMNRKLK